MRDAEISWSLFQKLTSQWRPPQQPPHGPHCTSLLIIHPPVDPAAPRQMRIDRRAIEAFMFISCEKIDSFRVDNAFDI